MTSNMKIWIDESGDPQSRAVTFKSETGTATGLWRGMLLRAQANMMSSSRFPEPIAGDTMSERAATSVQA